MGRKFKPHYRIIAIHARTKREGRALEELGHYNPMSKELVIKKDRAEYWLSVGAQPTETAEALLVREGVMKSTKTKKHNDAPKKKSQERSAAKAEKKETAKEEKKDKVEKKEVAKEEKKVEEKKEDTKKEEK